MSKISLLWIGLVLLAILVALELLLRWIWGFGRPVLYQADAEIGYLLVPNQQTRRFGNHIAVNPYSMRSSAVSLPRPAATQRILFLGDSIINGGWWTDQQNTIPALVQQQLELLAADQTIEVLNASANSWGPRNQLAYLRKFGSFEAETVVLVINIDDLFATAPASAVVGRDVNYPDRLPLLALEEVLKRYVFKPNPILEQNPESGDRVGINLTAIQQIQQTSLAAGAQFVLVITPRLREVKLLGSREYELKARQRLHAFAQMEQMILIDVLPAFQSLSDPGAIYQDEIHLNVEGNQLVAQQVVERLKHS